MIIKYGFDLYECEKLSIYNGKIVLNNKKISLNEIKIVGSEEEISLATIYKQLSKINKRFKIKDYIIILDDNFDNMEVQLEYRDSKIKDIVIVIGINFLYTFTEREILVYLAHELGHILDFDFSLKKKRFLNTIKEIGKIVSTLIVPVGLFYYTRYINDEVSFNYLAVFSIIIFSSLYSFFIKYLDSYYSRSQEYNADKLAVKLLGDAQEVIDAFLLLQEHTGQYDDKSSIFSTHPTLNQRINYLKVRYFYQWVWKFFFGSW